MPIFHSYGEKRVKAWAILSLWKEDKVKSMRMGGYSWPMPKFFSRSGDWPRNCLRQHPNLDGIRLRPFSSHLSTPSNSSRLSRQHSLSQAKIEVQKT